jgi:proline iminopeptidase
LRWVREGQGPPVFVIGSSVYYPKAYSEELREHFELIFVDGRHFVPSYSPEPEALSEVNLSTFANDVEAVRLALGYDRVAVVGHSVHGQIALVYADLYPASVSRLLLIGPAPYAMSEFAAEEAAVWEALASDERKDLLESRMRTLDSVVGTAPPSRSFAVSYDHLSPLYWADPSYDAKQVLAGLENGPAFGPLVSTLPSRTEAMARLSRLETPLMVVVGKLDFAIPYTVWEEIAGEFPNIQYILLEEDSHNPQTESPGRFDPIMIEWLSQH